MRSGDTAGRSRADPCGVAPERSLGRRLSACGGTGGLARRVGYRRSYPLQRWLGERRRDLDTVEAAHRYVGNISAAGRPREAGRRLGHTFALLLVADFQGFARDLHDVAAEALVRLSGAQMPRQPELVAAATLGRFLDRGNADLTSIERDFRRLGIGALYAKIEAKDSSWQQDRLDFQNLIALRNALAHGNERQLIILRRKGILDTRTWASGRRPGLNRFARALDKVVWEHLRNTYNRDPW